MHIGRRTFLGISSAALAGAMLPRADAQQASGMGGRVVAPQKKPTQSGKPFDAHFVDVAAAAGLTAPTIYGGVDHDEYILEANGCGCAFLDYDNDGWLDIFLLSGTRLDGPPSGAS